MMSSSSEGVAAPAAPSPATPEDAERLLAAVTTPEQAWAIYELAASHEDDWRAVKLKAERRYGELLGSATVGGHRKGHVTGSNVGGSERIAQNRARKVAAVPQAVFDDYIKEESKPSREGLLRQAEPPEKKKGRPRKRSKFITPEQARQRIRQRIEQVLTTDSAVRPRWTLEDVDDVKVLLAKKQPSSTGKRIGLAARMRARARMAGDPGVFWDTVYQMNKATSFLEIIEVEDLKLDEYILDDVDSLHNDMLRLQDFMDKTVGAIEGKLGEQKLRETLAKMRARTVANGCTAEEAGEAKRKADRLERRINNRLTA